MLPTYQIQVFLNQRTRNYKYACQNCVTVESKLLDLVPVKERSQPSLKREQEVEQLRRELDACNGLLKQNEADKKLIDSKNKELTQLKKLLDNNPGLHTLEYVEERFEEKLETFKETIEKLIKNECKSISDKSYSSVAKSGINNDPAPDSRSIKEAIKDAWREEEAEENDKLKRMQNIIVHGVSEQGGSQDKDWAADLVKDTRVRVTIKKVIRLGKPTDNSKRPLLISLQNEDEKLKLLGNLTCLKGIEKYAGVSITEDLTPEERKNLKELSQEAKQRNLQDNSSTEIWRVRGNSKNGFYLKKLKTASARQ